VRVHAGGGVMLPTTRELVREIADRHGVDEKQILSPYGTHELLPVRAEITRALKQRGYTITNIARIMKRDRHTIYYWLGKGGNNGSLSLSG
jgi:putative ATPase subunit gpP of terminase